ncbi:hypothetical protein VULLAG_LOCUS2837 [Vulpes lagopus]
MGGAFSGRKVVGGEQSRRQGFKGATLLFGPVHNNAVFAVLGAMNACMNLTVTGGYRGAVYAARSGRCLERFPNSSTSGKGSSGREGALAPSCLGVPSGASGVLRAFLTPAYRCLLPQSLTHGFSPVWVHGGVGRAGQLTPELERRSLWFRRGRLR